MITATSLCHPTTRLAVVRGMLSAASQASPGRQGFGTVKRSDGRTICTLRAIPLPASSYLPAGLEFTFWAGNRCLNDAVADALGYDLLHWTARLAERLAGPATVTHWS